MAWYNNIFSREQLEEEEKLNPAQVIISRDEGFSIGTSENYVNYANAYEEIEVVNRAVNMIVDDVAEIPVDVGAKLSLDPVIKNIRKSRVDILLNREPNPFQDVNSFKRNLIIDLLIDGNIFVYFDGVHLYQLPARNVDIDTHEKNFVSRYVYQGKLDYSPEEVIHVKENSFNSIYRGVPRLKPAWRTMQLLGSMRKFQDTFLRMEQYQDSLSKVLILLARRLKKEC